MIRRPVMILAVVAVLGQLALPILHAGSFAGGGVAFAICGGSGSDALLERLREVAPPDLLATLGLDVPPPADCGQCVTPVALAVQALVLTVASAAVAATHSGQIQRLRFGHRSPLRARGPPVLPASLIV